MKLISLIKKPEFIVGFIAGELYIALFAVIFMLNK